MEDASNGMSEYERERLKRIEENRKMLEELFPDGTSLNSERRTGRGEKELTPEGGGETGGSTYGSPASARVRTRCVLEGGRWVVWDHSSGC